MSSAGEQLAKLLRTPGEVIFDLAEKMDRIAGKEGVIDKIVREIEKKTDKQLAEMGFAGRDPDPDEVFQSLSKKTNEANDALYQHFGRPDFSKKEDYQKLLETIRVLFGQSKGFYLKEGKAGDLFRKNPPMRIMKELGYGDVEEMLAQEDIFELFCALRFVEDNDWMNKVFFVPFKDLTRDDFEKREIKLMVLSEKWAGIGEKFLGEKLHHMSHLKEMGVVFVIPVKKTNPGETLYLFFMTLHYLFEVDWHSRLFEMYSQEDSFAQKMIAALKVETSSMVLPDEEKMGWRIVPAYLAKKNENDPRLFEPHISPEAWHYCRVVKLLAEFSRKHPELGLDFWVDSDASARIIKDKLVSFDLFDNGVALVSQIGFEPKYLYHQQEALWNEIFVQYLGEEKLDKLMIENLDKGFVIL